jgi:hypothetical protein
MPTRCLDNLIRHILKCVPLYNTIGEFSLDRIPPCKFSQIKRASSLFYMEGSPTASYSSKAHDCPPAVHLKHNLAAIKWKHKWRIPPSYASSHMDVNKRCVIHAVSPFGCRRFDCHMSQREADIRSSRGLQAIAREWMVGGLYA